MKNITALSVSALVLACAFVAGGCQPAADKDAPPAASAQKDAKKADAKSTDGDKKADPKAVASGDSKAAGSAAAAAPKVAAAGDKNAADGKAADDKAAAAPAKK